MRIRVAEAERIQSSQRCPVEAPHTSTQRISTHHLRSVADSARAPVHNEGRFPACEATGHRGLKDAGSQTCVAVVDTMGVALTCRTRLRRRSAAHSSIVAADAGARARAREASFGNTSARAIAACRIGSSCGWRRRVRGVAAMAAQRWVCHEGSLRRPLAVEFG